MAGRELEEHEVLLGLRRGAGTDDFHHLLIGSRGVGKTVLMQWLREYVASEWSWSTIAWVAGYSGWPVRQAVVEEERRVLRKLGGMAGRVGRALKPDSVSGGVPSVATVTKNLRVGGGPALSLAAVLRRLGGGCSEESGQRILDRIC